MSFVNAAPDRLVAAARNLAGIGSTLSASNASAAAPTLAVSAAASDQVSAAVAAFFSGHARGYQTLSAQAAKFHDQFVQALNADANSYASTESANASPLRQLFDAAPETAAPGSGETIKAATGAPAGATGVPYDGGVVRGGTANPRSGSAARPVGGGSAPRGVGNGASTEAGTPSGTCGSGGVLVRPATFSPPAAGWSGGAARAGASGGLLSRLVDADGGNDRSGSGSDSGSGSGARNGVWLDGIRGAGLKGCGSGLHTVQRGLGAGGSGGLLTGANVVGGA
ncbi:MULTISPECIES: PE family protein [unclassified Mycobacterium]|uniref:PE family protein n=1 Tax=unclassified Mycobacterium TaxID=2642494 RepID=UPI0027417BCB|nr:MULTISPECIES: PE family protein [unclassified Mycobacterium]MDP7706483.1 PE family protein [Mycobacterium sp. TY815]MDP7725731.1 PE family protein [Mycobacterium sp. TY814]